MKRIHKFPALLLCLLTFLGIFPLNAQAQGVPSLDKPVSLTINHVYKQGDKSTPVTNVEFSMYLVAAMQPDGSLVPETAFRAYVTGGSAADWNAARDALAANPGVLDSTAPADKAKTDKNGVAKFPSGSKTLTPGLYYIPGTKSQQKGYVYETSGFLVCLPNNAENVTGQRGVDGEAADGWVYHQTATLKMTQTPGITDIRLVKIWKDSCHPARRPKSITVDLLCDGEKYDTITLPQDGKWEYTWKNLQANHDWTVSEARVTGYNNPTVSVEGNVIKLTNTCNRPDNPKGKKLPQTGQLWWPVPVLLMAGLTLVVIGLVRRREDSYEN